MLKVYSTKSCGYCKAAKAYLESKGVQFVEVKFEESREEFLEMVKRTGTMGVPVIENGDKFVVGFDKQKVDELISE